MDHTNVYRMPVHGEQTGLLHGNRGGGLPMFNYDMQPWSSSQGHGSLMEPLQNIARSGPPLPASPNNTGHMLHTPGHGSLSGYSKLSESGAEESDLKHCLVCGDVSSGHHYGVTTCEGCKVSARI